MLAFSCPGTPQGEMSHGGGGGGGFGGWFAEFQAEIHIVLF